MQHFTHNDPTMAATLQEQIMAFSDSLALNSATIGIPNSVALSRMHSLIEAYVALTSIRFSGYGDTHQIAAIVTRGLDGSPFDFAALNHALNEFSTSTDPERPLLIDAIFTQRKERLQDIPVDLANASFCDPATTTPERDTKISLYTRLESLFEQTQQALDYLCLELPRLGLFSYGHLKHFTSTIDLQHSREAWQKRSEHTESLVAALLNQSRLSDSQSQLLYWSRLETASWTQILPDRHALDDGNQRLQMYLDHDGFRSFKRHQALVRFSTSVSSLLDLTHAYVRQQEPENQTLREVYGFGETLKLTDPKNALVVEVAMEQISEQVSSALRELKKETLRFRNAYLGRPFPLRPSHHAPYIQPKQNKILDSVQLGLYRKLDNALIERCVTIANQSLRSNPLDPALLRGGLTQPLTFDTLHRMRHQGKLRIATLEIDGQIEGFEIVFIGKHAFPGKDFDAYFAAHPFGKDVSGFLKIAAFSPRALTALREQGVKESPFDLVHRRMMAELREDSIRYLLCTIRTEPVPNQASMQAAIRNFGLHSGSLIRDDGGAVPLVLEVFLVPVQFTGMFNSGLDY